MSVEFDKAHYKFLKKMAKEDGIKVASEECSHMPYNGITVAYMSATDGADCRMLHVAVSYCATEDKYSKKMGKYQALAKLASGEMVQLPLGQYKLDMGNLSTKELLLSLFTV